MASWRPREFPARTPFVRTHSTRCGRRPNLGSSAFGRTGKRNAVAANPSANEASAKARWVSGEPRRWQLWSQIRGLCCRPDHSPPKPAHTSNRPSRCPCSSTPRQHNAPAAAGRSFSLLVHSSLSSTAP